MAIPAALDGKDLMVSARTGTGKTAAFVLPALQKLSEPSTGKTKPRILVLTPTRELAMQVRDMVREYSKFLSVRSACIVGGMPYYEQLRQATGADIVVATPGRLIDLIDRGSLSLKSVEILVLDEADRMLDMGFINDVKKIAEMTPETRQTLLFTATLDDEMANLARKLLKDPERIQITSKESQGHIEQRVHVVNDTHHKNSLLQHLAQDKSVTKAIIFSSTKRNADRLAKKLSDQGYSAAALHGGMEQKKRNRIIGMMHEGRLRLLIATDVAARGLDVSGISHVINYDLPKFAEDYVHRIGRTGRAGAPGIAISFVAHAEVNELVRIERFTGQVLPECIIAGLEPDEALQRPTNPSKGAGRGQHYSQRPPMPGAQQKPRRSFGPPRNDNGPRGDNGPRNAGGPSDNRRGAGPRPEGGGKTFGRRPNTGRPRPASN
jgi:superfamily II DNA/RNA helicase